MRDIYDFNHIDPSLPQEKVVLLKNLYGHYHQKHYGYKRLYRGLQRRNFLCNLSAGKIIISAAVAGSITLNPATLTGAGLKPKKYDRKAEQANFAWIEYQKVLDDIRLYFRGEVFGEKAFLDGLRLIDTFVTDHCMEIPLAAVKKYEETFSTYLYTPQDDCIPTSYLLLPGRATHAS